MKSKNMTEVVNTNDKVKKLQDDIMALIRQIRDLKLTSDQAGRILEGLQHCDHQRT